jgi:zinc transport system ATP-binding protein
MAELAKAEISGLFVMHDGRAILEDINLQIMERDFLGLIGPNGGGKSTLLKALLGLIKPSRGEIRIMGRSPVEARRFVGYMPQKNLFDPSFPASVMEVVLMGRSGRAGLFKRYDEDDKRAATEALLSVGMLQHAHKEIGALSGGEQQRVFVARAIVSEPALLLLDEPESGMDAAQRTEFYNLLSRLNRKMAIVMVSHDISAISRHVTKVACLNHRLYYHGSKELHPKDLEEAYECPVEVIAHGIPHRVLKEHD